jgi:uncharacterized protein VirK/YbjX
MIQLMHADTGALVSSVSFSVTKHASPRHEIIIGGLQGRNGNYRETADCRKAVVAITRGLHGLRPKALLLFAVQQVCSQWKISSLRGVSNKTHVHRDQRRGSKLRASYDSFWEESGGHRLGDETYVLPTRFVPREEWTISPKKRSLYRARYRMQEIIGRQIHESLAVSRESEPVNKTSSTSPHQCAPQPTAPKISRKDVLAAWALQRRRSQTYISGDSRCSDPAEDAMIPLRKRA